MSVPSHDAVAIVAVGLVWPGSSQSCLDRAAFWRLIRDGRHATIAALPEHSSAGRLENFVQRSPGGSVEPDRCAHDLICGVQDWEHTAMALAQVIERPESFLARDRPAQFSIAAAWQALQETPSLALVPPERRRVIMGHLALPTGGQIELDRAWHQGSQDAMLARYAQTLQEPAQAIAERFGFAAGAHTLDAACASSLFAVWEGACELMAGRCDLVLAGGVQASDALFTQVGFAQLGALSNRGRCRPFDKYADGLVVGEGAGVFVLRRLSDAVRQGDTILAVLRGGALSNDRDLDLLRPSREGQLRAMRSAYASADLSCTSIDLLECHATGTLTGDKEELHSFAALRQECESAAPVVLGATKANVGHWLTGAGAASLAKVIAAMQNQELPPLGGFRSWGQDPALQEHFEALTQAKPWPVHADRPRRAAVSAFGFGGTNAHLLLDAYEPQRGPTAQTKVFVPDTPVHWEVLGNAKVSGRQAISVPGCGPLHGLVVPLSGMGGIRVKLRQFASTSPRDMQASSAQQMSMLLAAQAAWQRFEQEHPQRAKPMSAASTGVWIALESDPRAAAFARRWQAETAGEETESLPSLDAAATLGHLGGIVASRVARELGCGGPCYVVSAQERVFRVALERAVAAIERGDVEFAVVGAVACLDDEVSASVHQLRHLSERDRAQEGALAIVIGKAPAGEGGFEGLKDPTKRFVGGQNTFEQAKRELEELYELRLHEIDAVQAPAKDLLTLATEHRRPQAPMMPVPAIDLAELLAQVPVHESFLQVSQKTQASIEQLIAWQQTLAGAIAASPAPTSMTGSLPAKAIEAVSPVIPGGGQEATPSQSSVPVRGPRLDRAACLKLARGSLAELFGPEFAPIDELPSRVRLPEEPLMLVDRVVSIDAQPLSMQPGSLVTEHDVHAQRFYLDAGAIPTCMAVESGQADLFLSGYLGIDLRTKGLAHYRLLDAVVTFLDDLPKVGQTIRYEIKILEFFNQGGIDFFRFAFDAFVGDRPLMTMRDGCAGFFTPEQLAQGKGVVRPSAQLPREAKAPCTRYRWVDAPIRSLDASSLGALVAGDLQGALGPEFAGISLQDPLTLPKNEKMRLVHEVSAIEPNGGRWNLGRVMAHADIAPDDWFLTCHFHDDKVMPGTLMYECCLHSLRILMMAQGWVASAQQSRWQPVKGVQSRLKCRGQVLDTCKKVDYEVHVREIGFGPEPYVIADAVMYADGKAVVDITDMSLSLKGQSQASLQALWDNHQGAKFQDGQQSLPLAPGPADAVYDQASILAFSIGQPSKAFGAPYKVFDETRKIARLPGPPFLLMDRVVEVKGEPFVFRAGAECTAQVDVTPDAWYFAENRQTEIPYSILLEMVLQPCGWLAGYVGSALQSEEDLCFRNLGGKATLHAPVSADDKDVLTTKVTMTELSSSAGMILQSFRFCMHKASTQEKVYEGTTQFGFFSAFALARQVGIRPENADLPEESGAKLAKDVPRFTMPAKAPYPGPMMRMIDKIVAYLPEGGPAGLGWIRGEIDVNPEAWFFSAHFYQDPVWPGSLGIEAFLQLVKSMAYQRWPSATQCSTVKCGHSHEWMYRGQVIPSAKRVRVEAQVTALDHQARTITARGWLFADDRLIYKMDEYCLRFFDAVS